MKKTYYIFSVIASTLLLAGCAKETAQNISDEQLVEYSILAKVDWPVAEAEDGTKVTLNSFTPAWEEGDEILVLDAAQKPVGKTGSEDGGIFTYSSGKFTGKVKVGQTPKYAIYPASAATVDGDAAVTAGTLMNGTDDKNGSIKGAVMLGSSSNGTTFTFTNACAVLKINTGNYGKSGGTDPAITSVKVSASYGSTATPVAGAFTIDWTNLSISKASSGAVNELTIAPSSGNFPANQNIYIPILPLPKNDSDVAPSMAFEFTNANGGTATVSHDFTAAITANTLKTLGTAQGLIFRHTDVTISTLQDWLTFSSNVNSGSENYSGATIDISVNIYGINTQEEFTHTGLMIEDTYGVLNDAILDFNNKQIAFGECEYAIPSENGGGFLFNTLTSDNVTIRNLNIYFSPSPGRSLLYTYNCFGGFVGKYTGSKLTIKDCSIYNLSTTQIYSIGDAGIKTGIYVGETTGDVNINGGTIQAAVYDKYTQYGGIIGYASGNVNLSFNDINIYDLTIGNSTATTQDSYYGLCLGYGSGNLNINIENMEMYGLTVYGASGRNYYTCPEGHGSEDNGSGAFTSYAIGGIIEGTTVNFNNYNQIYISYHDFSVE